MTTPMDSIESQAVFANSPETRQRVTDIFSRDEIKQLTARSDWMGAWAIVFAWSGVAAIFAMMAYASHFSLWVAVPAIIIGMVFLAGRQLALSIIVHDAAHGTLFKTRWMNNQLTDWLCARPLWNDLPKYRAYHFVHHTRTGTDDDPDSILRAGYPTTPRSLLRKFARDLSGIIGIKYVIGRVLMDAGVIQWTVTGEVVWLDRTGKNAFHYVRNFIREAAPMLLMNALFIGILAAFNVAWLYGLWVLAHLTFFMLLMRIRSMAEHAACAQNLNMFENTRTVKAGWLARALVAPIGVNYHMEHHILASCPWFRLADAHRLLRERNAVPEAPSYWQMLHIMARGSVTNRADSAA